ncbi:hypothetical protein, partial [Bacteroides ovatus]|uniref:hypothetical protein n=1 Tax=Bacteroides ovatus TaxID=28116 RepID=UPI00321AAD1D
RNNAKQQIIIFLFLFNFIEKDGISKVVCINICFRKAYKNKRFITVAVNVVYCKFSGISG